MYSFLSHKSFLFCFYMIVSVYKISRNLKLLYKFEKLSSFHVEIIIMLVIKAKLI